MKRHLAGLVLLSSLSISPALSGTSYAAAESPANPCYKGPDIASGPSSATGRVVPLSVDLAGTSDKQLCPPKQTAATPKTSSNVPAKGTGKSEAPRVGTAAAAASAVGAARLEKAIEVTVLNQVLSAFQKANATAFGQLADLIRGQPSADETSLVAGLGIDDNKTGLRFGGADFVKLQASEKAQWLDTATAVDASLHLLLREQEEGQVKLTTDQLNDLTVALTAADSALITDANTAPPKPATPADAASQ